MKQITLLIISGLTTLHSFAQTDSTKTDSTVVKPKASLTLGATYTNNANYYGQRADDRMPYVAFVAAFNLPSGFYFSGSAYKLIKEDSGSLVSASSLGAGYGFKISKRLSADLSYSHTFYPAHSLFLQAANNNTASASLSYKYWLTSGISADYAFGKQNDVFLTFNTSKNIELGSLFSKKDGISIAPAIEISGGTQRFYQSYVTEKRVRDSILGIPLPPIIDLPGNNTTETTVTKSTDFNLLSWNFKLPLSYYRANYLIELAYQASLVGKKAESNAGKTNSFLNLSFYYQF